MLGIATMIGFAIMQTGDVIQGLLLSALIAVAIISLAIVSFAIIATSKRINTSSWSYVWRQGLANLYRPRNQTFILVLSLGLGTTLIMTQVLIQHNLLEQVSVVGSEGQPNLIMFDVQTDQLDGVKQLFDDQNLPVMFEVPVVTMRISSINGVAVDAILRDSSSTIPRWTLNREYRSTYRKSLVDTESLLSGSITPEWSATDRVTPIPISLEEDIAADLNVSLGDSLTIDVQGVQMKTIVGGIRKVDWQRVQPNFFIVFPDGPLNTAPQFHVLVSRTETREASANIQRAVVENYPNVSAVDLDLILATIQSILDKAAFVIRFMALFSIITGLIVLAGSVIISKYQRIRENVLLRTIGASRKQIIGILLAEYTFLSMSAALAGLILSGLAGWSLSYFVFDGPFSIPALTLLSGWLLLTTLTLSIAWLNSRNTLNRPPLEVLREEL
jgi:putative ABC transport system permease protein